MLFLFSISCSDESSMQEEPLPPEEKLLSETIIGDWSWQSFEVVCEKPEFNIPLLTVDDNNCIDIEGSLTCDFNAVFKSDNTVTFSITQDGNTNTADLIYKVDDTNNVFDLCYIEGSEEICQSYEVSEDSFEYVEDEGDCAGTYVFVKS